MHCSSFTSGPGQVSAEGALPTLVLLANAGTRGGCVAGAAHRELQKAVSFRGEPHDKPHTWGPPRTYVRDARASVPVCAGRRAIKARKVAGAWGDAGATTESRAGMPYATGHGVTDVGPEGARL